MNIWTSKLLVKLTLLEWSNWTCEYCNCSLGNDLQKSVVHHLNSNPLDYHQDNLTILCTECHSLFTREGLLCPLGDYLTSLIKTRRGHYMFTFSKGDLVRLRGKYSGLRSWSGVSVWGIDLRDPVRNNQVVTAGSK